MTARHASDATAMTKRPGQPDYVGAHRHGTIYVVVTRYTFKTDAEGYLLADTGEKLADSSDVGRPSGNVGWLEWDLRRGSERRLHELYPAGYSVVVTPRDGDVPADVQQANRDWYAGATA